MDPMPALRPASSRKRPLLALLMGAALSGAAPAAEPAAPRSAELVIRNVHVVDTRSGRILRGHAIVISNERISAVVAEPELEVASGTTVIDGAGAYAVPGLWDAHLHLMLDDTAESARLGAMALSYGITHGRDMGSSLPARRAYAELSASADAAVPRLLGSGPAFWTFELPYGDKRQQRIVQDSARIDEVVAEVADGGVDFIKVYAGFDRARLQALADAAARRGLPLAGHAQPGATLAEQASLGLKTLEHVDFAAFKDCNPEADGYFERVIAALYRGSGETTPTIYSQFAASIDADTCRSAMAKAAQAGLVFTPTLITTFLGSERAADLTPRLAAVQQESCAAYRRQFEGLDAREDAALAAAGRSLMSHLLAARMPLLAGTDAPAFCAIPGESLGTELALMADAGLPLLEVLQSATLLPSRVFGFEGRLGELAQGFEAHVVLLKLNPMQTVDAYGPPAGVYTRGRWRDENALVALRETSRPPAQRPACPQANGSCSTMVDSRPGPVETMASGQPASSSSARR